MNGKDCLETTKRVTVLCTVSVISTLAFGKSFGGNLTVKNKSWQISEHFKDSLNVYSYTSEQFSEENY